MQSKNITMLLPCPFCGYDKPKMTTKRKGGSVRNGDYKQIICSRCKARGSIFGTLDNRDVDECERLAIEAWNKRCNKIEN